MKSDKGQMLEPDSAEPQKQTGGNRKGKHDETHPQKETCRCKPRLLNAIRTDRTSEAGHDDRERPKRDPVRSSQTIHMPPE